MPPNNDRDPVDALAEEFAEQLRRGEHPSVSDFAAGHPDYADQLRDLLPAVAQIESLKRFRRATDPADTGPLPDRFGDFRIVRELGRGGMGVVFEAVQESLGRSVALKVLSSHSQLDNTRRERFVREAHAAARMHHTNIVPVFGVGQQDGLPYYAMQLIPGKGLNAVINGWRAADGKEADHLGSTIADVNVETDRDAPRTVPEVVTADGGPEYGDWAFVAEVGTQVADALHYAHEHGVLHRDVKPANLILDAERRVWVADFGLAKLIEEQGLTPSGDILGTLQYMPPESLSGKADARGDVYGLGATLYELITLEPPYPADTPGRLIKQIADTDPTPPREINPDIPRDLETIVLKAMARDPAHRYPDARELARDLEAFLDDRPIQARQTLVGRAVRWCRKNPAMATVTSMMLAAMLLAGVFGWVSYAKTERALNAEKEQLKATEDAKQKVETASRELQVNLDLCLESFEKVFEAAGGQQSGFGFGGVGPGGPGGFGGPGGPGGFGGGGGGGFGGPKMDWKPNGPPGGGRMEGKGGGPGGGKFEGKSGEGPGAAAAGENAAVLEAILTFYDKFAEKNATFAEKNATNEKLQREAGRARRRVGELYAIRGNTEKARTAFRRAASLLEDLHGKSPDDAEARCQLVQTYLNAPPNVFPDHEHLLERSVELAHDLEGTTRPDLLGLVYLRLGQVREQAGNKAGAEQAYREAISTMPASVPEQLPARLGFARVVTSPDRLPQARKLLEDATAEPWRVGGPGHGPPWERDMMQSALLQLADVLRRMGDREAAENARFRAEQVWGKMGGKGGFGGPGGKGGGGPKGGGGGFGGPGGPKDGPPPPEDARRHQRMLRHPTRRGRAVWFWGLGK